MAKCFLNIEAEDIDDLFATLRRGADHLSDAVPVRDSTANDPGAEQRVTDAPKMARTRRTKAEMAEAEKPSVEADEAGPGAGQPKGNGKAEDHELTLIDVKEEANKTLARHGSKGEKILAALEEQFGTRMFSKVDPPQFAAVIEMLKGL